MAVEVTMMSTGWKAGAMLDTVTVPDTTVVPFDTITVWVGFSQTGMPLTLTDAVVVTGTMLSSETVPLTTALTLRPGTTETTWVPRTVMTVPRAWDTGMEMATVPLTTAETDRPGTTDTTWVPRMVM